MLTNIFRRHNRQPQAGCYVAPLISVCLPVYDTEPVLERCLRSVITQDYPNFEIVIVSDKSRGYDSNGRDAKQIALAMQRECSKYRRAHGLSKVNIYFREHRENRGLIEVRRTLMHESSGEYIAMVDSDDVLEDGALSALAGGLNTDGGEIDIVHGTTVAGVFGEDGLFTPITPNRYGQITYGTLTGHDIFRGWLAGKAMSGTSWGKLIRREVFEQAFAHIPYTECNMAEDFLLFFFISQYAHRYVGIRDKVYRYGVTTGMSSVRKIDTLHKWKMVCSAASVFSVIIQWIEQETAAGRQPLADDEMINIRQRTSFYLQNNLLQLRQTVVPDLQNEARQMLCDYWGQHFVERMEEMIMKQNI
ncbi:MAG: glycosyltransferase family 2 protein [Spirochaetales bacterium]|nr:glycosyltransferase family 2 protein [Spirochaetales bacterium]